MRESHVQRAILDYLAARRVFHYRQNTGAFRNERGDLYWFGVKGAPDIVAVKDGRYIGIECKAPRGRQSVHQRAFQEALEAAGGRYILARKPEDVWDHL